MGTPVGAAVVVAIGAAVVDLFATGAAVVGGLVGAFVVVDDVVDVWVDGAAELLVGGAAVVGAAVVGGVLGGGSVGAAVVGGATVGWVYDWCTSARQIAAMKWRVCAIVMIWYVYVGNFIVRV